MPSSTTSPAFKNTGGFMPRPTPGGVPVEMMSPVENPDILAGVGHHKQRPTLVVGFAAETQDLLHNAEAKLRKKGADFIVANDVSQTSGIGPSGVMGGDRNRVRIVSKAGVEEWPEMGKDEVAARLAALIAERLKTIVV